MSPPCPGPGSGRAFGGVTGGQSKQVPCAVEQCWQEEDHGAGKSTAACPFRDMLRAPKACPTPSGRGQASGRHWLTSCSSTSVPEVPPYPGPSLEILRLVGLLPRADGKSWHFLPILAHEYLGLGLPGWSKCHNYQAPVCGPEWCPPFKGSLCT